MININIFELFKKNKYLFIISFIFFSLTPYFLINYQEQRSKQINLSNIKIFDDYENTININYIIEKFNVYNRILNETFSEIQTAKTKENREIINIINPADIEITFGSTNTVIEMNKFKKNYISLLYNELFTFGSELEFEKENIDLIKKYFKDTNFDLNYFTKYFSNMNIKFIKDQSIEYIKFNKFTNNHDEFVNLSLFAIEVSSNRILKKFYQNLDLSYKVYLEDFNNLLFLRENIKNVAPQPVNLTLNYNPVSLKDFIDSIPLQDFKHKFVITKKNYQNSFRITQPGIRFIILFSFIISIAIIYIKEKYITK